MSVMKEIEEKEYLIHQYQKQLEHLESLLGKRIIDSEERSRFEKDINELKDDLFKTEKELKYLRRENRKVFLFGLAIFILMVMILFYYKY